jgi:hypothetical protein
VTPEVKPRRIVYLLPLAFLLGAGIPSAIWLAEGIEGLRAPLERMVAPGTDEIRFDEAGRWTIFYESRSTIDGRQVGSSPQVPSIEITVTSPAGDERVVQRGVGTMTYQTTRAAGQSIGHVDIVDPGAYTVVAEDASRLDSEYVIAFGHEKGRATARVVSGAVLLGASLLVTMLIFGLIFFVRIRSRRRIDLANASYGMPPPPPGY